MSPTGTSRPVWSRDWLVAVIILLATLAVFGGVLDHGFVAWDDDINVYGNPHILGWDGARLHWMFTDVDYAMRYKPLTWLSYALINSLGGLNPAGFHLAGLLFHGANAVLLFGVVRRLMAWAAPERAAAARATGALAWSAGLGVLLWAVNPLRVEPVARVTDLTYPQSVFFTLLSFGWYLRALAAREAGQRGWNWYAGSVAAFALAMLTYPFVCGYTVVLLVLDFYPRRRFNRGSGWWRDSIARRLAWEKVPFALLSCLILVTLLGRVHPTGIWMETGAKAGFNSFTQTMQALYIWAYYVWKPWLPFDLSPIYTTLVNFKPASGPFMLSALAIIALTVGVIWQRRRWPWALALWACHLALLVPALGLTEQKHQSCDRYAYLPGLLWSVAVAAVLWRSWERPRLRVLSVLAVLAVVAAMSTLSLQQVRIWRDNESLFKHMIAKLGPDPYRADIHWRLGAVYLKQKRYGEAAGQFAATLQLVATPNAHAGLAVILDRQGNREEALKHLLMATQLEPNALHCFSTAVMLQKLGREVEAATFYRATIYADPQHPQALGCLAWLLAVSSDAALRNGAEAIRLAEQVGHLPGGRTLARTVSLAAAYAETGRFPEARETAEQARTDALAAGDEHIGTIVESLLQSIRAGRPYRATGQSAGVTLWNLESL